MHLWFSIARVISVVMAAVWTAPVRAAALAEGEPPVKALKITVLSTMLAGNPLFKGIGEWGFAALVEVDGRRILFDTGLRPNTVQINARELGIDLSDITDVVLSHHHPDHVGGLLTLRKGVTAKNPSALSRVHVANGIFWSRGKTAAGTEENPALALKPAYEATGGVFVEHPKSAMIAPGVWLMAPIPRIYPEKNWGGSGTVESPAGTVEDTVPEDAALVFDTTEGLVVLTGCGHAGAVNTLAYAREAIRPVPIHAAIGGFHLFANNDESLAWTAGKLRELGVAHLLAGHCTGIEASYRLRELVGLKRQTAVVAAVGSYFELGRGVEPLVLAK